MALDVTVCKYRILQTESGRVAAYRHNEPWRDVTGDGLILALTQEIHLLREQNAALKAAAAATMQDDALANLLEAVECALETMQAPTDSYAWDDMVHYAAMDLAEVLAAVKLVPKD